MVSPQEPLVREGTASISVVGVGGGGCNTIVRMIAHKAVPGVRYLCINTDAKSLERARLMAQGARLLQIGTGLTHGQGAGGDPSVGAQAASTERTAFKEALSGSDLIFITVGMGGGTGTGAAPVVAEVCKETGAMVVAVVTTPFSFEGVRRLETAHSGIAKLRGKVDNLILIHNDRLLKLLKEDVSMETALQRADEAVMLGVLSVAELVNVPGEINVDLADVKNIMQLPGYALMAIGEGKGPGGALSAAHQAVNNPLLDLSIDGARGVLFNVNGGPSLTLGEVNATGEFISQRVDLEALIFFGMVNQPDLGDRVRITIIATGIPDKLSQGSPFVRPSESSFKWETPQFRG